ncbi:DUF4041 domain-containing protein [Oceanobacter kriegii]|uniref:DUF4041 domain-containing protein n=1 Tax=Oceanobacter kriegii TaxID=64972 RepID=UPI000410E573|nr:DUF4041 domain-containing protein [Oceanobacter kriegii]
MELTEQQQVYGAVLLGITLVGLILALTALTKLRKTLSDKSYALDEVEKRFESVTDIEAEVEACRVTKDRLLKDIEGVRQSYKEKRSLLQKLIREVAIYDERIESAELGFYEPHFDFDTPDEYKEERRRVREIQKELLSNGQGIYCTAEWTVEGSRTKGRALARKAVKIAARAFNNECDSSISSVSWNNILRMEERIKKAFESINKLNDTNSVVITQQYLDLKLNELRLAHEFAEKKQAVKEEQAEIRRQMREEAKLDQEREKALKEEERFAKLLAKAKEQANRAAGEKLAQLNEQIALLDEELRAAHAQSERALSMAQQTKSGHVYVISNIGSFGENVYKIGMTRRLEPLDRVKELGDASVPFVFDVHAMIYSDDAPALESLLHRSFDHKRLNLVNNRKEFFSVTLNEIREEVLRVSPDAEFVVTAEARDFRESNSIREQRREPSQVEQVLDALPAEI